MYKHDVEHVRVFRYLRGRAAQALGAVLVIAESSDWWQDDQYGVYRTLALALIENERVALDSAETDDISLMP